MSRDMSLPLSEALSLEQRFRLQVLRQDVKHLTLHEAQFFIVEISKQLMLKENHVRQLQGSRMPEEL